MNRVVDLQVCQIAGSGQYVLWVAHFGHKKRSCCDVWPWIVDILLRRRCWNQRNLEGGWQASIGDVPNCPISYLWKTAEPHPQTIGVWHFVWHFEDGKWRTSLSFISPASKNSLVSYSSEGEKQWGVWIHLTLSILDSVWLAFVTT